MTELFYFKQFELFTKLEYIQETNSLRYASHRKITEQERMTIEQYFLQVAAVKTEYYKRSPSFLVYTGQQSELAKRFELYKLRGQIIELANVDEQAQSFASNLINKSMISYYGEKIVDALADLNENELSNDDKEILQSQLNEFVDAYNVYSDKKIMVAKSTK